MSQVREKLSFISPAFDRAAGRLDVVVATVLFVMSAAIASWYVPHFIQSGGKAWFYQQEFAPAVMIACGGGYSNVDVDALPALKDFLARSRDSLQCDEVGAARELPPTSMQRAFRYLISTVGWTWRLQGRVAWSALTPLYALLYGVTAVLVFAIFRQGMPPLVAALCAGAIAVSTLNLNNLPHLRDYGKAPFVLAIVLIALRLVLGPVTVRRAIGLAGLAGLVTGIGVGFRNDLLVAIPALAAVIALFLPVGLLERIGLRLASIAVYGAAVALSMYPMWSTYATGGGSSTQHLVLLGLTPAFTRDLGVDNSRLYEVGFEYRDELALAMIDNYADRRLGRHEFLPMYGAEYDETAMRYLAEIAATFPADLLTRVYASAVRIVTLPYSTTTSALMAPAFASDRLVRVPEARAWVVRQVQPIWPWALALALVALSVASVRLGLFATLLVFYLSGYPALQFQERHFFHLEFIAWFALGFAATLAGGVLRSIANPERRHAWLERMRPRLGWRHAIGLAVVMWCAIAIALVVPMLALRNYQEGNVRRLLQTIAEAPRTGLPVVRVPLANGRVQFETPSLADELPPDDGVHAVYVVAELGGPACDVLKVDVTQRYTAMTPPYDFTHSVVVPTPLSDRPAQLVFPAYFRSPGSTDPTREAFAFTGLELPASAAGCVMKLSRLQDLSAVPVLLDVQLRPDWQEVTPYATIAGVEARTNPSEVYAFPPDLPRGEVKRVLQAPQPVWFTPGDIRTQSRTFEMRGHEWRVDGVGGVGGRGPLLYLVEMQPRPLPKGSYFFAQGTIDKGGVTFGLVRNDEWVVQLHIVQTGAFAVVIRVPEDGQHKVIMANNLRGMSLTNRLVVNRVGLVAAVRGDGQ